MGTASRQALHALHSHMETTMFQPFQILCLEHGYKALYVELIQTLVERKQVWVRPIALAALPAALHADYPVCSLESARLVKDLEHYPLAALGSQAEAIQGIPWLQEATLCDLRLASDLLWPTHCFRSALDVEVIPIMAQLGESKPSGDGDRQVAQHVLQQFVRQVWRAENG